VRNQDVVFGQPNVFPQIIFVIIISLGEEFGWRGFALPRLQERYSALASSLILGVLWSLWHFPGYLVGAGVPLDMPFYLFTLWVIPATILMTWVYNNTSSVWAAILFHSSANMAFGLRLLPEQTGERTTFSVFVALVWLCAIVVAVMYGPRRLRKG
jgi:membrane protease YdiL (CAAX protease family)